MSKGIGCLVAAVVVLVIVGLAAIGIYNGLVGKAQAVDAQWAQVESVYQRRADLIPNLVATVQGAANFEKSTLEAITAARASVGRPAAPNLPSDPAAFARWQASQEQLSGALSRLMVVVERYPELRANQNFRDLQAQLEGTENRISVERMRFNDVARDYNTSRQRFPAAIFANLFGFGPRAYFQAAAGADQAPGVNFNFGPSPAPPPVGAPPPVATPLPAASPR